MMKFEEVEGKANWRCIQIFLLTASAAARAATVLGCAFLGATFLGATATAAVGAKVLQAFTAACTALTASATAAAAIVATLVTSVAAATWALLGGLWLELWLDFNVFVLANTSWLFRLEDSSHFAKHFYFYFFVARLFFFSFLYFFLFLFWVIREYWLYFLGLRSKFIEEISFFNQNKNILFNLSFCCCFAILFLKFNYCALVRFNMPLKRKRKIKIKIHIEIILVKLINLKSK